jgi:hypothetical protein
MLPAGPSETLSLQILTLPFIEKLGRWGHRISGPRRVHSVAWGVERIWMFRNTLKAKMEHENQ